VATFQQAEANAAGRLATARQLVRGSSSRPAGAAAAFRAGSISSRRPGLIEQILIAVGKINPTSHRPPA
jgi:hypothetical protein